jgi:hypothetical protein
MEETLEQIGEGRGMNTIFEHLGRTLTVAGIFGPGYQERRAERLQQNYGIEVPSAASS